MNMARAAANCLQIIYQRYSDGTPVEVVIADTTIGRVPRGSSILQINLNINVAVTCAHAGAMVLKHGHGQNDY